MTAFPSESINGPFKIRVASVDQHQFLQLTCAKLNTFAELRSVISNRNGAAVRKKGNSPERTFHYVRAR